MNSQTYNPNEKLVVQYGTATVVGLGVTGYSAARYLCARGLDIKVVDSRQEPPLASEFKREFPNIETQFGDFTEGQLNDANLIVASPGISLKETVLREAKRNGAHIVGDIELFLQENDKPVIAVTGSNGKSTVVTLVGEMCRSAGMDVLVAGNIGLPVLDALTDLSVYQVAILELSSFQLETTSQVPAEASAILNISADHMDRYDSMGDYMLAKARILRGAKHAVLPRHDEWLNQITNVNQVQSFELDEPLDESSFGVVRKSGKRWLMKGDSKLMKLNDVPLTGLHNVKNVLSAFALVDSFDLALNELVSAVKEFKGLAHRMQTIARHNNVLWVNDSKATNIGATVTALNNVENNVVWIAGGQGKGADFNELKAAITGHVKHLVLIGEDAPQIDAAIGDLLPVSHANSMQAAVEMAATIAFDNDVVLLSPACASFDMFTSFEHRGDEFANCVESLIARGAL